MTKYRIPVRVVRPTATVQARSSAAATNKAASKESAAADRPAQSGQAGQVEEVALDATSSAAPVPAEIDSAAATETGSPQTTETEERKRAYRSSESESWRERALRLQAEMSTYRRRQQRAAQEAAQVEQANLLKDILVVADNLDRALDAADDKGQKQGDGLAEGVRLTRAALQRTLGKHGLEQLSVMGKSFDPAWHEAVYVVPAATLSVEPGTVVEVLEAGYRRQGTLFRPAKVVVAQ